VKHRPLEPQRFIVMNLESPILCPLCAVVVPEGGTHECRSSPGRDGYSYTPPGWQEQRYTTSSDRFGARNLDEETIRQVMEKLRKAQAFHASKGHDWAQAPPQQPPPPPPPPPREPPPSAASLKDCAGRPTSVLAAGLMALAGEPWRNQMDSATLNNAFKRAAKRHHPDQGGTREMFETAVAIRDELRKRGCLS
jgi:hypothetical protein